MVEILSTIASGIGWVVLGIVGLGVVAFALTGLAIGAVYLAQIFDRD